MSVNLANVNIPLQQFQQVATGKYNAGEVRLAGTRSRSRMPRSSPSRTPS